MDPNPPGLHDEGGEGSRIGRDLVGISVGRWYATHTASNEIDDSGFLFLCLPILWHRMHQVIA